RPRATVRTASSRARLGRRSGLTGGAAPAVASRRVELPVQTGFEVVQSVEHLGEGGSVPHVLIGDEQRHAERDQRCAADPSGTEIGHLLAGVECPRDAPPGDDDRDGADGHQGTSERLPPVEASGARRSPSRGARRCAVVRLAARRSERMLVEVAGRHPAHLQVNVRRRLRASTGNARAKSAKGGYGMRQPGTAEVCTKACAAGAGLVAPGRGGGGGGTDGAAVVPPAAAAGGLGRVVAGTGSTGALSGGFWNPCIRSTLWPMVTVKAAAPCGSRKVMASPPESTSTLVPSGAATGSAPGTVRTCSPAAASAALTCSCVAAPSGPGALCSLIVTPLLSTVTGMPATVAPVTVRVACWVAVPGVPPTAPLTEDETFSMVSTPAAAMSFTSVDAPAVIRSPSAPAAAADAARPMVNGTGMSGVAPSCDARTDASERSCVASLASPLLAVCPLAAAVFRPPVPCAGPPQDASLGWPGKYE